MGDLVLETKNWPEAGTQMFVGEVFRGDHVLWADARLAGPGRNRDVHGLIGVACGNASGVTGEAMRVGPGRTISTGTGVFARGALGVAAVGTGLGVHAEGSQGVVGLGTSEGVVGAASAGTGVLGQGTSEGVQGEGQSAGSTGVVGIGGTSGVVGVGTSQGVWGEAGPGMFAVGVLGRSAPYFGVFGDNRRSTGGAGCVGYTDNGVAGVVGVIKARRARPPAKGNAAVWGAVEPQPGRQLADGVSAIRGDAAVVPRPGSRGALRMYQSFAGIFNGPVDIQGPLTLSGPFPKSAAVRHPDGSHRRLYCLEAPESLFEDVGRARLRGGSATVRLDSTFAALIRTNDYHVFLTAEGECDALHVAARRRNGFTVREAGKGRSGAPFSYRIVAKRRDLDAPRLERVTPPVTRGIRLPAPDVVNAPVLSRKRAAARRVTVTPQPPYPAGAMTPRPERAATRRSRNRSR
jgi:hypothetical protein